MENNRPTPRLLVLIAITVALQLSVLAFSQNAPVVQKVDPPNWWAGITSEVLLMVQGENLTGISASVNAAGAKITRTQASANGHYCFIWLSLKPNAHPGTLHLNLRDSAGSKAIDFPLLLRADSKGHYQGVSRDDVIYLIMPDRFSDGDPTNDQPYFDRAAPKGYHGGDLRGIRNHLDYLHDLGVTTIWLTPVWKNADSDYHGYGTVDLYALDSHMGSMQDYHDLVSAAHKLGIKVILDYVANHTGPKHPWANDPPTPTWLHGTPDHHLDPAYEFSGVVDPHAAPRESRNMLEGWFAGVLPDLNPDDPILGLYLAQNAIWWTESAALDGYRLDTFPYSSRAFWSQWHKRVKKVYPESNSIGEVWNGDPTITSFFQGGRTQYDGIDSNLPTLFDFPLSFAIKDVLLKDQPVQRLVDVLQRDSLYPHPEVLVTFLGNHDTRRFMSEVGADKDKLKAAFALLLTTRGIPQIYTGDEIGMPGGDDPDNRRDFPGGFPDDTVNAFSAAGRSAEQAEIFNYLQSLLKLRAEHSSLRDGKHLHVGWGEAYYAFVREDSKEKLLIVLNNGKEAKDLSIPTADTPMHLARTLRPLLGSPAAQISGEQIHLSLSTKSVAIYAVE
ncbi:MAG TPA: alpha-amylase family glycosyl hydrolase [Candidatus Sulfotelmatobacter sp.]|jgi:glycosidase|nr:alpha-amylase family glycosyl hydrolase [Candidatus Sulfotelmatobacter sp.]